MSRAEQEDLRAGPPAGTLSAEGRDGPPRVRRRLEALSRSEIVEAALALVDEEGLDALTMRRLGDRLGVQAMALYRHVRDKDELLDLLVERILVEIPRPELSGEWRADAVAIARATRTGLARHRRAVALLQSRPWAGPAGLAALDITLGVFRRGGFDPRAVVEAQFALGNYVSGFSAWEASNLGAASDDPGARTAVLDAYRGLIQALPADTYPNLVALADQVTAGTLDGRFEAGLEALLTGLAARRGHSGS